MGSIPAPDIFADSRQVASAPMEAMQNSARLRLMGTQNADLQQQQQERDLQMQQQRRQMADQDALTKTLAQYDPKQHSIADIPKLVTSNGGSGEAALKAQAGLVAQKQNLLKLSDDQFAQEQKKADAIQGLHDEVTQADPLDKQNVYSQGLRKLAQIGVDTSQEPPQYPGDAEFAKHLPAIRLHSAIIAETEKARQLKAEEQKAQAAADEAANKQWEKFPELGMMVNTKTGEQKSVSGGGLMPPGMIEAKYVAIAQRKAQGLPVSKEDNSFLNGVERYKKIVPVAQVQIQSGLLNDQAKQMAAQLYQQTGQLPAGMRSPAMAGQILNTAAGAPGAEIPNIAANKAEFQSNEGSLKALQKNFDQVTAFENTAGKNLDNFLAQAKKVVDFGSPLVNMPLRKAATMVTGSENQAAFNAARTTALTEISKVLNSSNASGVLSDSARHEVEGLIGPNATLKQIYSAANILKQDMANRHQAYQDQISEIKGRLGGKTPTQTPPPSGGDFFSKFGGKAKPQ